MHSVLVTGGNRGIGAAICICLKELGYNVIGSYNANHEQAAAFSKKYDIPFYSFDLANPEITEQKIQEILKNHGPIDCLVHNAGITNDGFFHKMTLERWQNVLQTNLLSCFQVTHPLIQGMRERSFGRLVYVTSVNALKGQIGQTNYCAAKAGLIGFVKALALENANKNITVNAIAPGYTETDMVSAMNESVLSQIVETIPAKRLAKPEEIADSVAFLLSDKASYITGTTLHINGGMY
ncbi:MAG: beta-ketoacyl-ACP reductase [Alphaproteobacteria bacterium]